MTPELTALALAALLQGLRSILMPVPATLQRHTAKTLSAHVPHRLAIRSHPTLSHPNPTTFPQMIRALTFTATCCALTAGTAHADHAAIKADLALGAFVMITRDYDSATNTLRDGPPPGEAEACFQVIEEVPDGIILRHLTGIYHPWWSNQPIQPGGSDTWFTSDAWRDHHPGAGKLDELLVTFSNVPACKATP